MDKVILYGVIRSGCDSLGGGGSRFLGGIGDTTEFFYSGNYIIIRATSFDDVGCHFDTIGSYPFFYLVFFLRFSATMRK